MRMRRDFKANVHVNFQTQVWVESKKRWTKRCFKNQQKIKACNMEVSFKCAFIRWSKKGGKCLIALYYWLFGWDRFGKKISIFFAKLVPNNGYYGSLEFFQKKWYYGPNYIFNGISWLGKSTRN